MLTAAFCQNRDAWRQEQHGWCRDPDRFFRLSGDCQGAEGREGVMSPGWKGQQPGYDKLATRGHRKLLKLLAQRGKHIKPSPQRLE